MNKSISIAIALICIGTAMGSVGAFLLKKATKTFHRGFAKNLINYSLLAGLGLYGFSTLFYSYALKFAQLSFAYPLVSLGYIWTMLLSKQYLNEEISIKQWSGVVLILLGVLLIALAP